MSKMLRLGALVLALSLVLTACGGGFSDEARNEFMAGCEPGAGTEFCECTLDELEKTISEEDWGKAHALDGKPYPKDIAEIMISKRRNGPLGEVKLHFSNRLVKFENIKGTANTTSAH